MKLTEKAAYIKGLMEGMKFDDASDSNKLLAKLTEIVSDMAHAIDELEEKTDRTNDYVDELDYDLGELEELIYCLLYTSSSCSLPVREKYAVRRAASITPPVTPKITPAPV